MEWVSAPAVVFKQKGMTLTAERAPGVAAVGDDLARVVDPSRFVQQYVAEQRVARRDEAVEIEHRIFHIEKRIGPGHWEYLNPRLPHPRG